jgi:transposase
VLSRRLTPDDFYSRKEIAKALDVHISTVVRWTLKGVKGRKLESFDFGGQKFVLHEDLERFLFGTKEPGADDRSAESKSEKSKRMKEVDDELDRAGF